MSNRLEAMETFIKVVETGSFTAAARALRLPKASATTRIQALEKRLGVRLLHRTTRKVTPTTEGALYFEECSRLLRELEVLETSVSAKVASPAGRLRVDVPASAGRHVIAPAVPAFLERYPTLTLELGSTDRAVDLVAEGVDCVIRGGTVFDETLARKVLGALPVVTVASPRYLAAHGTPKKPSELGSHVFVNFFSARTGKVFEVDFARDGVEQALMVPHRVAANDSDTWVALAVAGLGLLQAPLSTQLREHLREGRLVRVLERWSAPALPVAVLWPQTRLVPTRVRVFIDWVTELYAAEVRAAEAALRRS